MADAQRRDHQSAGERAEIDVQRAELGPEAPGRNPLIKAGDEASAGIVQRRGDSSEMAPVDAHVTIGDDQRRPPRRADTPNPGPPVSR